MLSKLWSEKPVLFQKAPRFDDILCGNMFLGREKYATDISSNSCHFPSNPTFLKTLSAIKLMLAITQVTLFRMISRQPDPAHLLMMHPSPLNLRLSTLLLIVFILFFYPPSPTCWTPKEVCISQRCFSVKPLWDNCDMDWMTLRISIDIKRCNVSKIG